MPSGISSEAEPQLQNMDMMREAIEKRASETLAAQDGGPFLKGKIRRDDGRAAFVTLAEYFEDGGSSAHTDRGSNVIYRNDLSRFWIGARRLWRWLQR